MRRSWMWLALIALGSMSLAVCSARVGAQTPPPAPPCPAASPLLRSPPIYGVGVKTIENACPAFVRGIDQWFTDNRVRIDSGKWTSAQIIRALTTGVVPTPPAPIPPVVTPPSAGAPWLVEDFARYSSINQLVASSGYVASESQITNRFAAIVLDTIVGYGSSKSLRFDYLDATSEGGSGTLGRCTNSGHGVSLAMRPPATKQLWMEVYVRFSPNFTTAADPSWRCTSGESFKHFIFGVTGPSNSRFNLEGNDSQWLWGYPDNEVRYSSYDPPQPKALYDGKWHRYRFALAVSSSAGVADGRAQMWVDDTLRVNYDRVVVNRSGFGAFYLGSTRNQGSPRLVSWWLGRVTIYTANPGW